MAEVVFAGTFPPLCRVPMELSFSSSDIVCPYLLGLHGLALNIEAENINLKCVL